MANSQPQSYSASIQSFCNVDSSFRFFWTTVFLCIFITLASVPTAQVLGSLPTPTSIPPVEEAIRVELVEIKDGSFVVDLIPVNGVYLYRDKLKFSTLKSRAVKLGVPRYPSAQLIVDDTFGRVHVFRGPQQIRIPYQGAGATELTVDVMGCHGIAKVCYPPHQVKFTVDVPKVQKSNVAAKKTGAASETKTALAIVRSSRDLDTALRAARGRFVMVDLWATWCTPCKQMEKTTFANSAVVAELKQHFVTIKVDVSTSGVEATKLLKRYDLVGPPGFAFYSKDGTEIAGGRLMGFVPVERFLTHLELVRS